jgi:preprotein translocase subunit Sss1
MANNTKYIGGLLEKYWEGNTSIEEEREIKKFFREESLDIPSHEYEWLKLISEIREKDILYSKNIETFLQYKKPRLLRFNKFLKVAAIFILAIGLVYVIYLYNRRQSEMAKEVRLSQKAEADLFAISQTLQQGMQNFKKSEDIISHKK